MFEIIMAVINTLLGLYLLALGRGRPLPKLHKPVTPEREAHIRKLCTVGGWAMLILAILYVAKLFVEPGNPAMAG